MRTFTIKPKNTIIYYALTDEESKQPELVYDSIEGYDVKGVHTSLSALKKFVRENNLRDILTKYVKLPIDTFTVDESIIPEDNIIAVKIPFRFYIHDVKDLVV